MTGAMATLVVAMLSCFSVFHMPTANVGMEPKPSYLHWQTTSVLAVHILGPKGSAHQAGLPCYHPVTGVRWCAKVVIC